MFTAVSLFVTEGVINICFNVRSKKHKPKIQNTIKFKTLNVTFGMGLLAAASFHLVKIHFDILDTYVAYYSTSAVLNSVLAAFIFANKDAIVFIKRKVMVWKGQLKFGQCQKFKVSLGLDQSECSGSRIESLGEIGPWIIPNGKRKYIGNSSDGQDQIRRKRRSSLFVIDID